MAFDPTNAILDEEEPPVAAGLGLKRKPFNPANAVEDTDATQGVTGTLWQGAKSAARALDSAGRTYTGNGDAVVDNAQAQQEAPKDYRLENFYADVQRNKEDDAEDAGLWDGIKNVGGAIADNPAGAGLATVEMLPNAAVAIGGGYAGMKAGALAGGALGTAVPVVGNAAGAAVGGVIGGLTGMFIGNTAIETGHKAMAAADDGQFTPDEMDQVQREGAIKGGVITAIDGLTLGLGGKVASAMQRTVTTAMETATRKVLVDRGIDVADEAAVLAARQSPEISTAVRAAQDGAIKVTDTLKRRATEAGTLLGMESVGEGLGEYLGELAATGEADVTDAVMEAALSLGQSGAEAAWNISRNRADRGQWEPAKIQPMPTADNPNPAPIDRPDPNAGSLSRAANLLPAPDTQGEVFVDGSGNASTNRPAWVNPENVPNAQSFGPGMDQQAARGEPVLQGDYMARPRFAEKPGLRAGAVEVADAAFPALTDQRERVFFTDEQGNTTQGRSPNVPPRDYVQGGRGMDQQTPVGKTYSNVLAAKNAISKAAQPGALEVVKLGDKQFEVRPTAEAQEQTKPVLQNRDRSTPASVTQMRGIAAKPDYQRVSISRDFANGAPVVEPGASVPASRKGRSEVVSTASGRKINAQYAVIEAADLLPSHDINGSQNAEYENGALGKSRAIAGNGRVTGISHAYTQGTAGEYRRELEADAGGHGISPAAIKGMKNPVLVRIMPQDQITQDIGDESNTATVSALSGAEQARNDAKRIDAGSMAFDDNGEISEATVRQFIQAMPEAERSALLDGGRPSRQAYERAASAVFASAYESDELVRLQAQATDPEARTVLAGLLAAASKMARLKGQGQWDIRGLVVEAAQAAVNATRNGQTLAAYAQQLDIERNPEATYFIDLFAANSRSGKRIGEELSAVADTFYAEASKSETDMFGAVPRRSRQEILGELNGAAEGQPGSAQPTGQQAGPGAIEASRPAAAANDSEQASAGADAQAEAFQLNQQTEEELAAADAASKARIKAEEKAQAEADEKQRKADEQAQIKAQSEAQADNFTLGANAEDSLSGQGGMFDSQPSLSELGGKPANQTAVKDEKPAVESAKADDAPASQGSKKPEARQAITQADELPDSSIIEDGVGNVALFSRVSGATRDGVFLDRGAVQKAAIKAVGDVAARFVYSSYLALPVEIKESAKAMDIPPHEIRAVHWNGTTYLVDGRFKSALDVERAVYHEHYAHFGMRAKYGAALGPQLRTLLEGVGGLDGLRQLAEQQNIDLSAYEKAIAKDDKTPEHLKPLILMDELLAHVAETGGTLKRLIQEYVGMLRAWLRQMGYKNMAGMGVTDLAAELRGARKAAQQASKNAGSADVRFMFAGAEAATADQYSLDEAAARLEKGESATRVRLETGWSKGADNKWRFEIADDEAGFTDAPIFESFEDFFNRKERENYGARVSPSQMKAAEFTRWKAYRNAVELEYNARNGRRNLGELLDHPKLFAAYPDLAGVQVSFPRESDSRGSYYPRYDTIEVALSADPEQMLSTLLHEVQHAIQHREGFAMGGNSDRNFADAVKGAVQRMKQTTREQAAMWRITNQSAIKAAEQAAETARYGLLFESATRLMEHSRRDRPSGVFRNIRNEMQWLYDPMFKGNEKARDLQYAFYEIPKPHNMDKRNAFISKMAFDARQLFMEQIPAETRAQFKADTRTMKGMLNALEREARNKRKELRPLDDLNASERAAQAVYDSTEYATSYDIYRALAGEAEARNTQARQKMTDAERRAQSPASTLDVDASKLIVMFGGMDVHAPSVMASQAQPETIYIGSMFGDGTTRVLKNPTRNQALAFAKAAKHESMRGIVDPATGDLYLADSYAVDHKMLAEGVGLTWEDVRYSTDPETGSSNRLSIPANSVEFYPRPIFSGDQKNQSARYRLADGAAKGIPLFSARAIAKKVMAATGLNATVVNNESELPADLQAQIKRDKATGRVAGIYHNGTAYLVASNLRDTQHAISVMLHEAIGHGGVQSVLGDKLGVVMREIYRDMPKAMRAELERRYAGQMAGMSEAEAQSMIAEEYVAHLAETDPQHSVINRLVALLRKFIRATFGDAAALKWSRNDLVQLLAEARAAVRNNDRGPKGSSRYRETNAAMALAELPDVSEADESAFVASLKGDAATRSFANAMYKARGTESPFFKAWFGKSRMVDKQGQPIAFVHRSYGERDTFTDADLGKNTGTPTATLGHFLARKDVGNVERYGPVVEQFYIRMEKPKVITQAQFEAMGDWSLAKVQAYRKTLMERGHDGLYIQGLAWPVVFEGKNIKAKRNQGTFDESASTRYSLAQTATAAEAASAAGWKTPSASQWDDLTYKLQDKHIDTKRVLEAIRATGKAIGDDLDVYLQEELYHGRAAKRTEDFATLELEPLMQYLASAGLKMQDVEEYLHARHAREANRVIAERNPKLPDGGSGMTNAEADAVLASYSALRRKQLETAAAKVDAIIASTRQTFVEYGLESQETVDAWGKTFAHYVPLMREQEGDAGMAGLGTGQGFSIKGRETKGRTGSTRKVVDILANIASQRERAIVRGEKNRVAAALVGLAKDNPSDLWQVDVVPTQQVLGKDGKVKAQADPLYKQRDNVVVAKIANADGTVTEHAVVFNEDDARALRMATALKSLDAPQLEGLLGATAKVTRYLAAVNTQYNPIFGVTNLARDVQGAALNLSSTPLAGKQREVLGQAAAALGGIYADMRSRTKGKGGTRSQWAKLWEEFQDVGGQTGYRDQFRTSADRGEALAQALDPSAWTETRWGQFFTAGGRLKVPLEVARKGMAPLFAWLNDYNTAMENSTRLAAYKVGLDAGMSKAQAASLAKNLTTNFNRKGQSATQVGALYAFFNASVQGTARIGDTLFDMEPGKPKTLRLSAVGKKIVVGGVMLGGMQAMLLAAAGFGDDEPPEFVRERNLIIPTGGKNYITIPMPLGFHVLPNLGRMPVEFALSGFENPAEQVVKLLGLFSDAFNPIGSSGLSMQTLAPTVLDPLAALSENKDFSGRAIAKESFNKLTPGHALARDTASLPALWIAEGINYLTGGTKHVRGALSPTPDQIDYLVGQVTGGVGREVSKTLQTSQALATGDELPAHKVPLLGRFYGNADSPTAKQAAFYRTLDDVRLHAEQAKGLRLEGKTQEAIAYTQAHKQARFRLAANAADREVRKLRERRRELEQQGASREMVRAIDLRMTQRMERFTALVGQL